MMIRRFVAAASIMATACGWMGVATPANADTTVTVTPSDVSVGGTFAQDWDTADTRPGGTVSFVTGPATPPLGAGSLQLTTNGPAAKAQLFTDQYAGVKLADISALAYSAFRAAASTNNPAQTISLNIAIDINGGTLNPGEFATLVFEPVYNLDQGPITPGTWQAWDAYNGGGAIWWSTKSIPGVPLAFDSFVPWSAIVTANPNATVIALGYNIGSGWAGQFLGATDALAVGVSGTTTTFDFEPDADNDGVPDGEDACPNSDLRPFVDVNGSEPGVTSIPNAANGVNANGCTIQDLVNHCATDAKNHGQYVSCVTQLANDLQNSGVITGKQKGEMTSAAAKSKVGK